MSHQQLISDLKSSRDSAEKVLNEIFIKLSKCKDNTKAKSSTSYNTVHAICMAIKDNGQFYEIYADAIEKVVADISDHHWNMFVELLRFILSEFYTKNLFKLSVSLAFLATSDRIVTPADVKSHLKLYSRQLYYSHMHLSEEQIQHIFKTIARIVVKCTEVEYDDLLDDFYTNFLGFPSMLQTVIMKHLEKAAIVFEKLFPAISSLQIAKDKLNSSFLLLMKFLINFIHLDVTDKKTVFSQNFLRSCKDNLSFKGSKYQSFALNLFYYFVKLLLFSNTLDFNENFVDILGKFASFFEHSELAGEPWFMDTIVTMTRILDAYKTQKTFLQAMDEDSHKEAYTLIEKLIKLAPGVNYDCGLWTCCNSVRKHIIFKLCNIQLVMFETAVEQGFTKPELSLSVYTIIKHTLNVAEYFKCTTVNYEVALIVNGLARSAQNVKTKEHGEHLAKMLTLPARAKAPLPENATRTLLKCLLHTQKVSDNLLGQLEASALYIAYLVEANMDTDLIRRYIGAFYAMEPCMSILETLDESNFPLKSKAFSRRMVHSMETGIFFKMRTNNILVTTSLLKSAPSLIDFVLVARQCPQVKTSKDLERKYGELKKAKSSLTPLEYLAFGHICKIRAVQQMDDVKNLFSIPKVSDESLPQIVESNKLKLIDVTAELLIQQIAFESIEAFNKFFEYSSTQSLLEEDFFVEWEPIIDDVAMLARLFHFRGYVDYAYKAWRLLLKITTHVDDILNRTRALAFMCDGAAFIELFDPHFDIDQEIKRTEQGIYECLMNLEFLTPRRQNYVLICICNIGWYWAMKGRFEESQLLLDLALGKVEDLNERKNKFELVRATHLAVSFRIKWKLQKQLSKRTAFAQVDQILDEIRAVVYYTSEDTLNFPTLLFALVNDVSEFTTNRLSEPATLPYVQMVLKLALDTGAAYRIVQFLVLWTHINLQSENVAKCKIKLDLIDVLFRNTHTTNLTLKSKSNMKLKVDNIPMDPFRAYGEETVRKAVYVNPVSPVRLKHQAPDVYRDLETFLISHDSSCNCDKCAHAFLGWQFFKVGCLNARLLYLGDAYKDAEIFYTKALEWCAKTCHRSHTKFHFKEYEFTMLVQYINLLRRIKNFDAALTLNKVSLESYNKFKNLLDGVYHINLSIQLESTKAEMLVKPIKSKESQVKRILKFSPSDPQPTPVQPVTQTALKRKGRVKKESPQTLKESIDDIIYKDLATTPAKQKSVLKSSRRKEKSDDAIAIDEICKTVEEVKLSDEIIPKKPPTIKVTTSTRRRGGGKPNLNAAIIIIDDDDSPTPAETLKIPKSANKVESTPKTRGRSRKIPPATVAVSKSGELEVRTKLLRRRI